MKTLSIDFETRAVVDLRKTGIYPYAADPNTEIWCMAWAFDDEDVQLYDPNEIRAMPRAIYEHVLARGEIRAWNAQFERLIWREIMVKRYGWLAPRDEQFVCTMAEARAMGLPGSLDQAARALGLTEQKDTDGYNLMMRMTRPRSILADGTLVWWDNAEGKVDRLKAYCQQDVRTERSAAHALRRLTPKERGVYLLDQRINDLGVRFDRPLIEAAVDISAEGGERAAAAMAEFTGGAVDSMSKPKALIQYLQEQGLEITSVAKPVVAELLSSDLDPALREILQLRADFARTSVAKLKTMLAVMGPDDLARGLLAYHVASTGRWAGRLIQTQNFPRGTVPEPEQFIPLVLERRYDHIDLLAPPLGVISSLLRATIVARAQHMLLVGDFAAIEARVLNWLAGQSDILDLFRQYDAGDKSRDPYKMMAVRMGRAPSVELVTKDDRQAGKAAVLGCGFQMAAKKFVKAAWDVYQVRVDLKESALTVKTYREVHYRVKQFWHDLEDTCLKAVAVPGAVFAVGHLKATVRGEYLYIVLPSGRPLCYAAPRAVERTTLIEIVTDEGEIQEKYMTKVGLEFSSLDAKTNQWGRERTYGGKLAENVTQAVARDLLAEAMLRIDAAGLPIVLHTHDEIVCDVPCDRADAAYFEKLMSQTPKWAEGCPIAVEAWAGPRYRK